jgi:antitoxin VapB
MAFHIKDADTDRLVRELAARSGMSMTEAVRRAAANELARVDAEDAQRDKGKTFEQLVREIQDDLARFPRTGLKADKAYYDELSGGM